MIKYVIEILVIVILAAAAAWAIYKIIKKSKHGGGCCGEREAAEKSAAVRDRNKADYPYSVDLKISGMTCQNCAKRVENSLNSLDGVWAKVNLSSGTAHILSKQEADIQTLCGIIAKAGYTAEK